MVNEQTRREIKSKAREINRLSENFQLVHATYACQEYIKQVVRDVYQSKLNTIKERITEKINKNLPSEEEMKEKKRITEIIQRNCFNIYIEYMPIRDEKIARIVKEKDSFTIYLAASLRNKLIDLDGKLNYEVIGIIRKLMAHELGHIVLHTKDVLMKESAQGTLEFKGTDQEQEADVFGNELLELRKERNKKISQDGGAYNLF